MVPMLLRCAPRLMVRVTRVSPLLRLALRHQIHPALGAPARLSLPNMRMHRADIDHRRDGHFDILFHATLTLRPLTCHRQG